MEHLLMGGQKNHHKAQAQPIWILIGLLLAMIIGIMMYQIVSDALSQTPELSNIDRDTAEMGLNGDCTAWKRSSWAIAPQDPEKLSDYAARLNLLSENEWTSRERFSACDCAMYLYVTKLISKSEVREVYDPDYCHDWANEQAENFNIAD